MRILMLGNSLTSTGQLYLLIEELTGAQVTYHTRGGARLAEQLNPKTRLGARTLAALSEKGWDYVVLQEMSCGPITSPVSFQSSAKELCRLIRQAGAVPVFYATWAYQKGSPRLAAKGWDYDEMARNLSLAYSRAAEENQALLAPVGDLFYRLSPARDLYAPDGVHPSREGSRLAAQAIARVILEDKEKYL